MKPEEMSCIDCTVKNCDKGDKTYPAFCLTTHMDQEILQDAPWRVTQKKKTMP